MSNLIKNDGFLPAKLRATVLRMAFAGSTVHIACAFSIIEILAVLYRSHLNLAGSPDAPARDYLVLSKGHGVMAQYACLYELGWLSDLDIDRYFSNGTKLKGLSDAHVPGLEVTSGSLGHGVSIAAGLALAAQRRGSDQYCYCVVGDGEMNEGAIWEAILFASHFKLDNFMIIVDENRFQAMGPTEDILDMGNFQTKFEAFGFDTVSIDGHDEGELDRTIHALKSKKNGLPKAIVARTVKGKGVSFMAEQNLWHYTRLTKVVCEAAMQELSDA